MDSLQIDSSAIDGVMAGLNLSTGFLNNTLDNIYIWTLATMTIGLFFGIAIGLYFLTRHTGLPSPKGAQNGVTDAQWATKYLDSGGDIKNAFNQEFIRAWARDYEQAKKTGFNDSQASRWANI